MLNNFLNNFIILCYGTVLLLTKIFSTVFVRSKILSNVQKTFRTCENLFNVGKTFQIFEKFLHVRISLLVRPNRLTKVLKMTSFNSYDC